MVGGWWSRETTQPAAAQPAAGSLFGAKPATPVFIFGAVQAAKPAGSTDSSAVKEENPASSEEERKTSN